MVPKAGLSHRYSIRTKLSTDWKRESRDWQVMSDWSCFIFFFSTQPRLPWPSRQGLNLQSLSPTLYWIHCLLDQGVSPGIVWDLEAAGAIRNPLGGGNRGSKTPGRREDAGAMRYQCLHGGKQINSIALAPLHPPACHAALHHSLSLPCPPAIGCQLKTFNRGSTDGCCAGSAEHYGEGHRRRWE